jgi:hypothetical protein
MRSMHEATSATNNTKPVVEFNCRKLNRHERMKIISIKIAKLPELTISLTASVSFIRRAKTSPSGYSSCLPDFLLKGALSHNPKLRFLISTRSNWM